MLAKINRLKSWQVACVLAAVGLAVFFTGLNNPFQGDDSYQIVTNVPVHSISHILLLLHSSTFYNGQKLTGIYYRPMMSIVFSFIYTLFGAHPLYFHVFQLIIFVASSFLIFLIFKRFFKAALALFLALILLVHPLNSQVAFAIPSMQDALFFFFGTLALWILMRFKETKSLWPYWAVAGCLFLSFLSKETALMFIVVTFVYVLWYNNERVIQFARIMLLPIGLYILLKTNAVGLNSPQHGAPIDNLGLIGRLFTDPSIILFYLTKFIFPWKLASGYYWTYPTFSVRHVLLPLVVDIAVIGLFVYLGKRVKNKLSAAKHRAYLFFAVWAVVGMLPYLQIIPLDMTACETWFYLSMAGMLGMIGIIFLTIKIRVQPLLFLLVAVVIIGLLGVRTAIRGTDYRSQYILARDDLKVSTDDYSAMNDISEGLITDKNYKQAAVYAKESAVIFPTVSNYNNLGVSLEYSENFPGAVQAYNQALKYGSLSITYENLAEITLVYGTPNSDLQLFEKAIKAYPHDSKIWLYLAVDEDAAGSSANARAALSYAVKYGQIPQTLYNDIYSGQPFALSLPIYNKALEIR